jgi:D-threo-aldose 1-dehydrogenase
MDSSTAFAGTRALLANVSPRLGFGCAHLYAGRERAQSLRLLETALDCGVTYFDTARLYGHGESEALLGSVLAQRRDRVFIATKAGILPTQHSPAQRLRDRAARALRSALPLRSLVQEPPVPHPIFGAFQPHQVLGSLSASLRALHTDYVDLLLLHECRPGDVANPALQDMLARLVDEGKVRAWGIATDIDDTIEIVRAGPPGLSALQFASSVFERNSPKVRAVSPLPAVTHSSLSGPLVRLMEALKRDDDLRSRCNALGLDPEDAGAFAQRMLAASLADNPDGIVLFSAGKPEHIPRDMAALNLPTEQVTALAHLVDRFRAVE